MGKTHSQTRIAIGTCDDGHKRTLKRRNWADGWRLYAQGHRRPRQADVSGVSLEGSQNLLINPKNVACSAGKTLRKQRLFHTMTKRRNSLRQMSLSGAAGVPSSRGQREEPESCLQGWWGESHKVRGFEEY